MKKTAAIILSLALIIGLCSCGGSTASQPAETPASPPQATEAPAAAAPAPAAPETPVAVPAQEEPAPASEGNADDCMAAYRAFLIGEQKLEIPRDYACFTKGESYYIDDFRDAFMDYKSDEWGDVGICRINYGYLDCGSDGIPELALEFELDDEENYTTYYHYFVINCLSGAPSLVNGYEYYYRSYSYINEAGIVENGGSSGAASYYYDYIRINGDGSESFIYSCSTEMANPKPAIPSYFLPKEIPDDYYDMFADNGDGSYYTVHAYNFNDFDVAWDDADYDKAYDIFCRDYFFTITDDEGDDVAPAAEYADLYKANNINIVTSREAGEMLNARMAELGVTDEIFDAAYVRYSKLDAEKISDEVITNEDGSITVGCVGNLMDNVTDGATIYLKPGVYNLSDWVDINAEEYYYDNEVRCRCYSYATSYNHHIFFAGGQVIINRINDLTIASLDPDNPAEIITDDEFNMVMSFCECSDLKINGIVAGHSKGNEGHCSADVFEFASCDRVELVDCDLYGCGCYGICAKDTAGLRVEGGRIHDCTSGMAEIFDTTPVTFTGVAFENCFDTWGSMFPMYNSSADFYNCSFKKLGNMFDLTSSSAWLSNCTLDDAAKMSVQGNEDFNNGLYMYEY